MFAILKTININIIAAWSVGLCFAIKVLNPVRYPPDADFIDLTIGFCVLALGMALLIGIYPIKKVGVSTLTWLALTLLITLQPFISDIDYPDSLIFPMAGLLLATITAACVYNLPDKSQFLLHLAVMVFLVGLLSLIVQYIQLITYPDSMPFGVIELGDDKTPFGNVAQRNQAAYVLSLSLSAWFFIYYRWRFSIILLLAVVVLLASGIGMTSSRVGVILLFAALFMLCFFCNQANKVKRFISAAVFAVMGYFFGGWLVVAYIDGSASVAGGVQRLATSGVGNRLSLLQEAWWIFRENPIFGAGWGNFPKEGLKYAENLQNYIHAHHAHSLVPQIAAELGILGLLALLPVLYVLLTVIRKTYDSPQLFAVTAVVLSVLYSFTEYPLWYLGYFILFAALIACLDTKKLWSLTSGRALSLLLLPVLLSLSVASMYYYQQYRIISTNASLLLHFSDKPGFQTKVLLQQKRVLGFVSSYDNYLFALMPANKKNLQQKIQFGTRVVGKHPSAQQLTRLGILEILAGDSNKGFVLLKAACLTDHGNYCDPVAVHYNRFVSKYPMQYNDFTKKFSLWLQEQEQKKHKLSVE